MSESKKYTLADLINARADLSDLYAGTQMARAAGDWTHDRAIDICKRRVKRITRYLSIKHNGKKKEKS